MSTGQTKEPTQKEDRIRYILPVEFHLHGFPGNILLDSYKGVSAPYEITKKEQKELEALADKNQTSFDEELTKRFEASFNNSEDAFFGLSTFRLQNRMYDRYSIHVELSGAVRVAKEGEKGVFPGVPKPSKPLSARLRLRHILIITSLLAALAVLYVLLFVH